jgi:hypothetical protein
MTTVVTCYLTCHSSVTRSCCFFGVGGMVTSLRHVGSHCVWARVPLHSRRGADGHKLLLILWESQSRNHNGCALQDLDAGLVESYGRPDEVAADPVLRDGLGPLPVLPKVPVADLPKYRQVEHLSQATPRLVLQCKAHLPNNGTCPTSARHRGDRSPDC